MRIAWLFFVFTTVLPLAGAQAAGWRHMPVPGAHVYDLAILPDGALYAGTNDGVYRSLDAGASWTRTQSASPSKQFLRVHSVDGDAQRLIAYTADTTQHGGTALEASHDGGASWQITHAGPFFARSGRFVVHPATPGVVLFTEANTVLRSEDGGATWADLSGTQTKRSVFAVANRPGRYVAMLDRADRMLESNDGGATWSSLALKPELPQRHDVTFEQDPVRHSILYFAAYQSGGQAALSGELDTQTGAVRFFTDACGCSHVRVVPDPHRTGRLIAPAVAFDETTLAVTGRPLRESLDGGATWRELSRLPRRLADDYRWQFDPWQPGRIYLPTAGAGVYRSDDDGVSFTPRYEGMIAAVPTYLSVDPTNPADFLVARSLLPMLHSSDGGNSFSPVGMDFYSDYAGPEEDHPRIARAWTDPKALLGFDDRSFYRSDDGGRSWEAMDSDFPFEDVWIRALQFTGSGSDKLVALAERGKLSNHLFWSSDGGRHWTASDFGGWAFVNRLGTGKDDPGPVYVRSDGYSSQPATLWISDAFGGTPRFASPPSSDTSLRWTMSAPDPANTFRMLAFSDRAGEPAPLREVFETLDGATTWHTSGTSQLVGGTPVIDACDGRTVWETMSGRVSRDGGRSFGAGVDFAQYLADGFHALCFQGKSHVLTLSSRGISIREPEAGDTLFKEGHDP